MKQTQTMLAIALCTLAGAALAQSTTPQTPMTTPQTPMSTPSTAAPATAAQPPATTTAPAATTPAPTGSSAMRVPSRSEPADSAFRSLDTANRGYLSKSDVQKLDGISFDAADTNKDGRLSKEEFERAWAAKK